MSANPVFDFDDTVLPTLLTSFYAAVRADPQLGPVFADAVEDWDEHLDRLADFWSSVMRASARYKGNPLAAHMKHVERIEPAMFDRWLALWREATDTFIPPRHAAELQEKAERMARNLNGALESRRPAPDAPYRSTPVFDETTLPDGLRRDHSTRAGVWGVIRLIEGRLVLHYEDADTSSVELSPGVFGLVRPQQIHRVEPLGPIRMQVDFYDREPALAA